MNFRRSFIRPVIGILLSSVLFIILIGINFLQMLSLVFLLFSRKLFRKVNGSFASFWWGLSSWCLEKIQGVKIHFTGVDLPTQENSIIVVNHQVMSDVPALLALGRRKGRLADMKWFIKDIIKYVPGGGWGMLFLDNVFVKRDWHKDEKHIHATFKKFFEQNIPLWLTTFPEGTRFNRNKLLRSNHYAQQKGLPLNKYTLIPRTKGFVASVQGLRGHVKAVYDITIGFPEGIPSLLSLIMGKTRNIHLHIKRFEMSALPTTEADISNWLHGIFREKELLLERLYKKGAFL